MTSFSPNKLDNLLVEPRWFHGYANDPAISLITGPTPRPNSYIYPTRYFDGYEWLYDSFPKSPVDLTKNVMLISKNNAPWVRFVFVENPTGNPQFHGALGGEYKLTDGSVFKTRTGWSSRDGVINRDYRHYLDDEIVDVAVDNLVSHIYATPLKEHIERTTPYYLVRHIKFNDEPYWTISTHPTKVVKPCVLDT